MKTNTSITIYNKYFNSITRSDSWKRHVIHNVFWDSSQNVNVYKGLTKTDKGVIYIPFNSNYMTYFVDPKTFQNDPNTYWTIQNGDIIVKGVIYDEVSKQSDLERKYNNVLIISSFTINDFGSQNMQHIKVLGV